MSMTKNSTTENGIITTTITRTDSCGRVTLTHTTKNMEGSKYYVFVDADNEPTGMEHETRGEIGGLWVEGNLVTDYDGCGCLPTDIKKLLTLMGYDFDEFILDDEDMEWYNEMKAKMA